MDEADARMMHLALELAQRAARKGEIPVGAVVADMSGTRIFGEAHNESVRRHDPSGHAEILALRRAGEAVGNYRLPQLAMWTTLEPCAMCAGAISHARIARLTFAATDDKTGAVVTGPRLFDPGGLTPRPLWRCGPCAAESAALLHAFFAARR